MVVMRSWQRSFVAGILIVALGASTWATCVEGEMSPETQQMACCTNGHDACGPKDSPADCCQKDGPKQRDSITIAKARCDTVPVRIVPVEWATVPDFSSLDSRHRRVLHNSSPPSPSPSPPSYIAFSTLLI